jgi:hypothetical protein
MKRSPSRLLSGLLLVSAAFAGDDPPPNIPLTVPPGAPLRLYLTKKVWKKMDAPVEAKVLEPVFAFDHEVVPRGSVVLGHVSRLEPLSKWQRAMTILGGDFTPLHRAQVEFTTLVLADGRKIPLHTVETAGLNSIYWPASPKKKKPKKPKKAGKDKGQATNSGILGIGKQAARDRINAQINTRTRGVADIVRSPNKKEHLIDMAMARLPYHPQWVRRGTRFDAELKDSLAFGTEPVAKGALELLGSQPRADSVVHARLLTALDSGMAKKGEEVEALVVEPLFSPEHKLILPEGTRLSGAVVAARKARWFHRGGQLRFNFQRVDLPGEALLLKSSGAEPALMPTLRTQATLEAAEAGGKAAIKVDSEGGVKATESKTRLIAPVISVLIASRSADNDAGRHHGSASANGDANVSGRTLGGGSGFGLLGAAAAQSSRYVGTALGFYGMAWSVYSNVIARGGEVQFDKNAVIDIKFGARTPPTGTKFQSDATATGAP